ncbi:DUF4382 domain-containing protein [Candidatus Woesearchaeota archaeon]|nr:DUF4382 domain-containing protein [Candidatus Woesearchaeota archaeon]
MKNQRLYMLITIAVVALLLAGCGPKAPPVAPAPTPAPEPTPAPTPPAPTPPAPTPAPVAEGKGTLAMVVTDKAQSLTGITSVVLTVDSAQVHSASKNEWIDVPVVQKTVDLLALKKASALQLLGELQLDSGKYTQIRLTVSKVQINFGGDSVVEAKLPSGTLKIVGNIEVEKDKVSSALLDFDLDKSLHKTGSGKFILAPVIKLETKTGVELEKQKDNKVAIKGGQVKDSKEVGMDESGEMGEGKGIPADADIELEDGKVVRKAMEKKGEAMEKKEEAMEKKEAAMEKPAPQSVTVEADDAGFYPDTVEVAKGTVLTITFKVRTEGVYYAGLRITGEGISTGDIAKGDSKTVTLSVNSDVKYSSFWPSSGVKKADGWIKVK